MKGYEATGFVIAAAARQGVACWRSTVGLEPDSVAIAYWITGEYASSALRQGSNYVKYTAEMLSKQEAQAFAASLRAAGRHGDVLGVWLLNANDGGKRTIFTEYPEYRAELE